MIISVASAPMTRRLYRRARKIIGLLLLVYFPPRLFTLDHLFTRSDTRFYEPIDFFPRKRLSYYLSISNVIALTDTDTIISIVMRLIFYTII